jgi:hypothetical protein
VVLQAELLLIAGAVGLYLYDSALLLYFDEGILTPAGRGRWRVKFATDKLRLMGKGLFLPNPLALHRPLFRLSWRFPSPPSRVDAQWMARRSLFRPLAPAVWAMTLALFVLLPLGLFRLGHQALLLAGVLLYASIAAALLWTGLHRARLGLSAGRFAALAFESLACPPFALNLVRRISSAMPIDEDLVRVARALQAPQDWQAARGEFVARLDLEIDCEEEGSARLPVLMQSRRELLECPA